MKKILELFNRLNKDIRLFIVIILLFSTSVLILFIVVKIYEYLKGVFVTTFYILSNLTSKVSENIPSVIHDNGFLILIIIFIIWSQYLVEQRMREINQDTRKEISDIKDRLRVLEDEKNK